MPVTYNLHLPTLDPSETDIPTIVAAHNDLCNALDRLSVLTANFVRPPLTEGAPGLMVVVSPANFLRSDGTYGRSNGASLTLADDAQNCVWIDDAGAWHCATRFPTTPHCQVATVRTAGGGIEEVSDVRVAVCSGK